VDFQPTEDQKALRDGIRSFVEGRVPNERIAELEKSKGFDRSLWSELAEMGIFSLRLPEDEGGVGLGYADTVLVFAELGRRLVPGPLVWSHLAAGLIDGAATGETVVGGIDLCADNPDPILIEHLESLDVLLALRPEGIDRIDPKTLSAKEVAVPFDPLTPLHHVEWLPTGERVGDAAAAARVEPGVVGQKGHRVGRAHRHGDADTGRQRLVAMHHGHPDPGDQQRQQDQPQDASSAGPVSCGNHCGGFSHRTRPGTFVIECTRAPRERRATRVGETSAPGAGQDAALRTRDRQGLARIAPSA